MYQRLGLLYFPLAHRGLGGYHGVLAKMEDSAFQNLSFQIDIDLLCVAFIKLFDLTFIMSP